MQLEYATYYDKVYGCWLGKCICGTIGAPYEGMKQYIPLDYTPELFKEMLPNDDLDLQVLWLEALERRGAAVDTRDLAALFSEKNIYWPGEYAWFKKNYDRGIQPPYTAIYENDFYFEGMGCPIRGEIWGMIYPGNPDAAADICEIDGSLDHYGNSVYFERFWSSMVAAAFFESDIRRLLDIGLAHMPTDCRARRLVEDVIAWCDSETDPHRIMGRILAGYGHKDCTNSFQNMGIIVMALLLGGGDIVESTMLAVRQGFDTDCTAGNVGALLGAVLGAERLAGEYGFKEAGYKLTIDYARPTDRVHDLAEDTCRVGLHFVEQGKNPLTITGAGHVRPLEPDISRPAIDLLWDYPTAPYLQPGESTVITVTLVNNTGTDGVFTVRAVPDEGLTAETAAEVAVPQGERCSFPLTVTMDEGRTLICEKNRITLTAEGAGAAAQCGIGVIGKTPYRLYGPFWENIVEVPPLAVGESYYGKIPGATDEEYADNVRCYHLNTRVSVGRDYISEAEMTASGPKADYEKEGRLVFAEGDNVYFNQICPFDGQCAVYLRRTLVLDEAMTVNLQIGHTDAFRLWLNGELLTGREEPESWTPENVHLKKLALEKGENTLVVELIKRAQDAKFTLTFLTNDNAPKHIVGLKSSLL